MAHATRIIWQVLLSRKEVLQVLEGAMQIQTVALSTATSLLLGILIALVHMYRNQCAKGFAVTLALLPVTVLAVIMLVNGNVGTGVAVMGAFSLVRFRSVPGSSREIGSIFFAMAVGLATGMGYDAFALCFTLIVGVMSLLLSYSKFGESKAAVKELKVTIPENLDYAGIFDDVMAKYTDRAELIRVKTTNMGSLYELRYEITLKDTSLEKKFIDELRCRNGNLSISCGRVLANRNEL